MQKQKEVVRRIADEDDEDDDDDYPNLQKEKKEGSCSDLSKVIPPSELISLNVFQTLLILCLFYWIQD